MGSGDRGLALSPIVAASLDGGTHPVILEGRGKNTWRGYFGVLVEESADASDSVPSSWSAAGEVLGRCVRRRVRSFWIIPARAGYIVSGPSVPVRRTSTRARTRRCL